MRSHEQVIWDFVRGWLDRAGSDLEVVKLLMSTQGHYEAVTFHCQQAAEKFLKAYLVRYQIEFRKTHDLDELRKLAGRHDKTLSEEVSSCGWLTPFGVEYRYPGDYREVSRDDAERAFMEAQKVREAVLKRLSDYLSKGRSVS